MPGRVRIGNGGAPQRVPLRQPAGLAVAAFGLLDLGDQQPQPTLVEAGRDRGLCLATRLAGQPGLERRPRQQQAAFGMLRIGLGQPLARPGRCNGSLTGASANAARSGCGAIAQVWRIAASARFSRPAARSRVA